MVGPSSSPASDINARGKQPTSPHATPWTAMVGTYLFVVGGLSAVLMVAAFPGSEVHMVPSKTGTASEMVSTPVFPQLYIDGFAWQPSPEQGLLALAWLAGSLGASIHATQSFCVYLGNRQFVASWAPWYMLRPALGAGLGMLLYFVVRAGLLGTSANSVSPYGVVAFAGMAGLFAERATDKLSEVFDTMFRTEKRDAMRDSLSHAPTAPRIASVQPNPAPLFDGEAKDLVLAITGVNFRPDAQVMLDDVRVPAEFVDASHLRATLSAARRPSAPLEMHLVVVNPTPSRTPSEPFELRFGADAMMRSTG